MGRGEESGRARQAEEASNRPWSPNDSSKMEHPGGSGSVFEGSWSRISIDECVSRTPRHRRILCTTSPRRIASRFFTQEKSHSRLFCSSLRSPFSTSLLERTKHASVRHEKRTRRHTYTLYYYCAWSSNSWYSIQSILLRPRELIRRQILKSLAG